MSQETDESQKTESPTEHKLQEAFKKGQVTVSKEIVHWFMLMTAAGLTAYYLPLFGHKVMGHLKEIIESSHQVHPADYPGFYSKVIGTFVLLLGLPLMALVVAAIGATFIQTKMNISAESLKPKFSKLSLSKGFEKMLGVKSIVEFIKGLIKITLIISLVLWNVGPEFIKTVGALPNVEVAAILPIIHEHITSLFMLLASIMTVIAGLDYGWQKFQHLKGLRMSKQEIKDEFKELDGDPQIKQRQRRIRNDRARKKMMSAVPDATVVITNPTHFAIALSYSLESTGAPKVVAKGIDFLALKIREIATENEVPIIENPPLARALYKAVPLDGEIPREHYEAVAKIIRFVLKLDRKAANQ